MRALKRTDQGGSVAVFVLIGIILAVILIVSIYFIKQRGEQVRRDQAIAIYDKEQAEKKAAKSKKEPKIETPESPINNEEVSVTTFTDYDWSSALPETGSETNYLQVVGVFFLTVSIVGYLFSKNQLARSL